ncbi:MAG TPA: monovalent cation/H+ antiporter complex subunit F [Candidatus Limiplasma sp.]|nr:monovalent cation/H+ antiporter complex subunit F [Candidatus Limiplasma sp.]HRX08289.1 monovalent cation/H+ antiporter complex subunit F [Candidatus Limiplasma sp.]
MAQAYHTLYTVVLVALSVLTLLCLERAVRGPGIAERIIAINMICTLTLGMICILALMLSEGYLADIALLYAMIGFLAIVVLCKVYLGVAMEKQEKGDIPK